MYNPGPAVYYDPLFRVVLESYMKFLRVDASTEIVTLEPQLAYKYENDLFGLLAELLVPHHYHWIVMRLNDFNSPLELTQDMTELLIPSDGLINNIQKVYLTSTNITT